jgi:hypothetical protein
MRLFPNAAMLFAFALTAVAADAAEPARTLKLRQEVPVVSQVDIGSKGASHGDILAFQARVTGDNGLAGTVHGTLITIDAADGADKFEERTGQVYVDLGGGNMIVIAGLSVYADNSREMTVNAPQVRAIIGGTGTYIGAAGQVTTTRNADGSYEHLFQLLR